RGWLVVDRAAIDLDHALGSVGAEGQAAVLVLAVVDVRAHERAGPGAPGLVGGHPLAGAVRELDHHGGEEGEIAAVAQPAVEAQVPAPPAVSERGLEIEAVRVLFGNTLLALTDVGGDNQTPHMEAAHTGC